MAAVVRTTISTLPRRRKTIAHTHTHDRGPNNKKITRVKISVDGRRTSNHKPVASNLRAYAPRPALSRARLVLLLTIERINTTCWDAGIFFSFSVHVFTWRQGGRRGHVQHTHAWAGVSRSNQIPILPTLQRTIGWWWHCQRGAFRHAGTCTKLQRRRSRRLASPT